MTAPERTQVDGASSPEPEYKATGTSLAAIILALACFGAVMLLHVLRGDIDPLRQVMSEYANGSHGPIMTVVFNAFGLSSLALAFRLRRAINRRGAAKPLPLLLALAGVGLIAAGVFEVERPLVPDTLEELIHSDASVVAFVFLINVDALVLARVPNRSSLVELPLDVTGTRRHRSRGGNGYTSK